MLNCSACFQLGLISGTCCDPSEKLLDCCDAKQNGHYHEISNEWLGLMFSIGSSKCRMEWNDFIMLRMLKICFTRMMMFVVMHIR